MQPRFWMVLGTGAPTYRHSTKSEACKEAERLAKMNPNYHFTVLEAVATCVKADVQWQEHEEEQDYGDNLPF